MINEKERGEVVQNYRLAKNKEEQVVIESEIHGVGSEVIRGILWDAGVYPIGPVQIGDASKKIIELGITFGALRNYMKAFMDVGARTARKIFKDYIYRPWGDAVTTAAGERYTDLAQRALDQNKERHFGNGHPKQDLVPAPAVAAKPFSDEQCGLLIAGLLSLIGEKKAQRDLMNATVTKKQEDANKLLNEADICMQKMQELEKEIAEGEQLLTELRDLTKEK